MPMKLSFNEVMDIRERALKEFNYRKFDSGIQYPFNTIDYYIIAETIKFMELKAYVSTNYI